MPAIASLSFGVDDTGRRSWAHVGSIIRSFDYDQNSRLVRDRVHALTPGNSNSNNSHGVGTVNTATGLNDAGSAGSSQHQDEYHAVGVVDRVFTWRADDVITQITDQIRGVETSYDVDPMGRVTRVTHQHAGGTATQNMPQGDRAGSSSQAQYSQVGFGQNQSNQCMPGGEESYSYSQAGVLTKLHPDMTKRWADDVDTYGGTMPHQVGRTKFTYDKAGRVTQTVTKRLSKKPLVKHFYYDNGTQPVGYEDSDHPGVGWRYLYDGACRRVGKEQINTTTGEVTSRVMFLHEGDMLFGEYHTVNTMNPQVVGSARLWPTDPGTGEILGQITININIDTTGSMTGHGDGTGHHGYGGVMGADNSADSLYNQHNSPHNGGYSGGPYNHDVSTTDGAGGVLGWSQQRVDAVFYSMVCDLAGAPKELIDPTTGEVVGYATYTLFGKRHWAGMVSTPLLFTGQYEDTESGWVYNRFRYYDPHAGVYNAQDPLGLLANLGTAQGYVTNPVTWVDALGLKGCGRKPELDPKQVKVAKKSLLLNEKLQKIYEVEKAAYEEELEILKEQVRPKGFSYESLDLYEETFDWNIAGMRTAEGPVYFGMGATRDLNLSLHDSNIGILVQHGFTGGPNPDWFGHHAEQVLLRRAECDGVTPVEIQSIIDVCEEDYPINRFCCRAVLEDNGLVRVSEKTYMRMEEWIKMLSEFNNLKRM